MSETAAGCAKATEVEPYLSPDQFPLQPLPCLLPFPEGSDNYECWSVTGLTDSDLLVTDAFVSCLAERCLSIVLQSFMCVSHVCQ